MDRRLHDRARPTEALLESPSLVSTTCVSVRCHTGPRRCHQAPSSVVHTCCGVAPGCFDLVRLRIDAGDRVTKVVGHPDGILIHSDADWIGKLLMVATTSPVAVSTRTKLDPPKRTTHSDDSVTAIAVPFSGIGTVATTVFVCGSIRMTARSSGLVAQMERSSIARSGLAWLRQKMSPDTAGSSRSSRCWRTRSAKCHCREL